MRFVDPTLPSDPNSKLNRVIDEIIEAYHATAENEYSTNGKVDPIKGGSLMLFTDIGLGEQSAASRGFNMKAWIEKRLIEGGVKPDHIAFMRDNKAHAKKERLFDDLRQGRKRILIGGKDMETGVNAQKRLVYLGHLDAPWFPASVEQREGRIIRQGNQNKVVTIKAYATKGSYDSTMWGMNARKARFIEQAMSGDTSIRSMEDVSEASAFEMAAALASGDERYLKLAGLKGDVDRLSRLYSAHLDDQRRLRSQKMGHESTIKHNVEQVEQIQAAIAKRKPIAAGEFSGTADGKAYDKRDEFSEALFAKFKDLAEAYTAGEQTIGEIGGFPIVYNGVEIRGGNFAADATVTIPGDPDPLITFPVDPDASVAGIATRAANQVNGLDRELTKRQGYIAESKDAIEKIDRRLGAAFPEQSELQEKRDALADLEAELEAESKAASAEAAAATVEAESADIEQPINGDRFSVSSADRVRGFGSKEKLREFLADGPFGKFLAKRIDEGKIVLHDDASTIPGANGMKSVGGVTNIDGKIHLNAATLGRNRALGVALHELFHAGTMPLVGTKAWDGLIARLGSLRKQAATGSPKLRALHDAANRRIEAANTAQVAAGLKPLSERQRNEEFGAYLIEEYENLPQAYRSWVDEFLGQVKAWLLKTFGRQVGQVTPEQLRALAIMALRSDRAMGAEFEFDTSMQTVDQTATPKFKRFLNWFGDSKVVGADGKPLVVYHGGQVWSEAKIKDGLWLTENRRIAEGYADQNDDAEVKSLYVKMVRPLDVMGDLVKVDPLDPSGEAFYDAVKAEFPDFSYTRRGWASDRTVVRFAIEYAKKNGYDGVIHPDSDVSNMGVDTAYVVFRPEQIKSATGNNGDFDPTNPDIRASVQSDLDRAMAMTEDEYIAAVNPTGKRGDPDDRMILNLGDLSAPADAQRIGQFTDKGGRNVKVLKDADGNIGEDDAQEHGVLPGSAKHQYAGGQQEEKHIKIGEHVGKDNLLHRFAGRIDGQVRPARRRPLPCLGLGQPGQRVRLQHRHLSARRFLRIHFFLNPVHKGYFSTLPPLITINNLLNYRPVRNISVGADFHPRMW